MKKKIISLFLVALFSVSCFAQKVGVEISAAIADAVSAMAIQIASGSIVAVTKFSSDTKEMSEWLENETFRALEKKNVRLVERNDSNMRIIDRELDFQYSGAVSDESMANFGQRLGARYIVYGSFEQFGGMKTLDFRLTDIETFEVLVAKTYEIAKSRTVTDLLGSEVELVSIDDYIVALNNLDTKRNSVEKEMNADCDRVMNRIRAEYQKKIDDVTTRITQENYGYLSPSALRLEISDATKPLEEERELLIKPVAENSRTKFADQLSLNANNRAAIIRSLQNTTFTIGEDSVIVNMDKRVGERNTFFTLNMHSTDRYAHFSLNDIINPADKEIFKKMIIALEETRSIKGEVEYKVKQKDGADSAAFDIVIVSARIYDGITGDTFYKKTNFSASEADGGTINMSVQKTGTTTRRTSANTVNQSSQKKNSTTHMASSNAENSSKEDRGGKKKRVYFDFAIDGTFFVLNYDYDNYYFYQGAYTYDSEHRASPSGDFTFSIPFPLGFYIKQKAILEPIRLNVGIRGFYAQFIGIGFSGKRVDFIGYIGSCGIENDWEDISFSFVDLKLAIKVAKHFNFEFIARPLNFCYGYSPELSVGMRIPL